MEIENKVEIEENSKSQENSIELNTESSLYQNLINKIGFCRQTIFIFIIANLIQFIWGYEVGMISTYFESLGNHFMIDTQTVSFFICLIYSMVGIGCLIFGTLSTLLGRIRLLKFSVLIYTLLIFSCCFINDFYWIIIVRLFANLNIGIFNVLAMNLLCEFLPDNRKTFWLLVDSSFSNFGNLLFCIFRILFWDSMRFDFIYFKIVNSIVCLPCIVCIVLIYTYSKDSPIHLILKSKEKEAYELIDEMANTQNIKISEEEKIKVQIDIKSNKLQIKSSYFSLFSKQYFKLTFVFLFVNIICYMNTLGIMNLVPKTLKILDDTRLFSEEFQLIAFAIIQVPNGFIGGFFAENRYFLKKRTLIISSLISLVFYLLSYFIPKYVCIFAGFIMLFNSISFGISFIYIAESYPSTLRDQAQSFINFFVFIIGSWTPYIIEDIARSNVLYNYIYFGLTCLLCCIISFFLPSESTQIQDIQDRKI